MLIEARNFLENNIEINVGLLVEEPIQGRIGEATDDWVELTIANGTSYLIAPAEVVRYCLTGFVDTPKITGQAVVEFWRSNRHSPVRVFVRRCYARCRPILVTEKTVILEIQAGLHIKIPHKLITKFWVTPAFIPES